MILLNTEQVNQTDNKYETGTIGYFFITKQEVISLYWSTIQIAIYFFQFVLQMNQWNYLCYSFFSASEPKFDVREKKGEAEATARIY